MTAEPRVVLLYDGACRFCVRSLNVLKRFDPQGRIELVDATERSSVASRFPQAAGADFDAAMYAVEGENVYRGFDAFRRAMRVCDGLKWIVPLMSIPPVPQIGRRVYDMVARNRHSLGCNVE